MELKRFGMKGKLVSAKRKAFRLFRLIGTLGNEDSSVLSPGSVSTNVPLNHTEALLYWHELRKAEALLQWKRWMDGPR